MHRTSGTTTVLVDALLILMLAGCGGTASNGIEATLEAQRQESRIATAVQATVAAEREGGATTVALQNTEPALAQATIQVLPAATAKPRPTRAAPTVRPSPRPQPTIAPTPRPQPTIAPTPQPPPVADVPIYDLLLGKTIDDDEVASFIIDNRCSLSMMHYSCRNIGVELSETTSGRMVSVFLFAEGADKYHEYQGALPENITWTDQRAGIEQMLGEPDELGGGEGIEVWASYNPGSFSRYDVTITYNTFDLNDRQARMHHILIHLPQ
jgi:hypothetical protein